MWENSNKTETLKSPDNSFFTVSGIQYHSKPYNLSLHINFDNSKTVTVEKKEIRLITIISRNVYFTREGPTEITNQTVTNANRWFSQNCLHVATDQLKLREKDLLSANLIMVISSMLMKNLKRMFWREFGSSEFFYISENEDL